MICLISLSFIFICFYLLFLYTSLPRTWYKSLIQFDSAINISNWSNSFCFASLVECCFFRCFKSMTLWMPLTFFSRSIVLYFSWSVFVNRQRWTPGVWQPCLRTLYSNKVGHTCIYIHYENRLTFLWGFLSAFRLPCRLSPSTKQSPRLYFPHLWLHVYTTHERLF
jgi:hypothetical protein